MKKVFGIFIVMLLIICGIFYSVTAFSFNKNSQFDDEKVLTSINDPLTLRVEAKQVGYRIWLLKAYIKNTWQEKITVKWTLPCCFVVRYIVPGMKDFELIVYYPYRGVLPQIIPVFNFFGPGEEKLVQIAVFYGISNWILPLIADNCTHYFESFPILPEGDYRFEADINPYFVNNEYPQYSAWIIDNVVFHLAAPKKV
jgi:hypothetical protein